jgi:protein SCO1/2
MVQFVFVTVDPRRDTRERLAEHLARFDPGFVGLTGTEAELQPVWDRFFVFREIQDESDREHYLVDHTSRVYAVDKDGRLRLTFPFGMDSDQIRDDVIQLLRES